MFMDTLADFSISGVALDSLLRSMLLLAYMGLLLSAALFDLRRFIIPDSVSVGLLGLWPFWVVLNGGGPVGFILLGAAVIFVLGVVFFAFGFMGGGDVKLITVLALWAEPAGLPLLVFYTSLAGALLSIYWCMPLRRYIAPLIGWTAGLRDNKQIPYGVAIAFGGLVVAQRHWLG